MSLYKKMEKQEKLIIKEGVVCLQYNSQWGGIVEHKLTSSQVEDARAEWLDLMTNKEMHNKEITKTQDYLKKVQLSLGELDVKLLEFGGVFNGVSDQVENINNRESVSFNGKD